MKTCIVLTITLFVVGCTTVVVQQEEVTGYHDVSTNGQQIVLADEMIIRAVDLTMFSGKRKTKPKGSDVLVLIIDSRDDSLISYGVIWRNEVPSERGVWIRCHLHRKAKLESGVQYILKVVEVSSGGKKGWNEYGFASGDKYPEGMLIRDFNSRDKMDYAFKLIK